MDQPKFSMSFSNSIEKKVLQKSALRSNKEMGNESDINKHSLASFDKDTKLPIPKDEQELVIPLVESFKDVIKKKTLKKLSASLKEKSSSSEATNDLDTLAADALIEDSKKRIEEIQNQHENTLSIKIDASAAAEETDEPPLGNVSSLDDYDEIKISSFGAALLRGMGWNKDGVGRKNKRVVEIIEASCSKMLGLTNKKPSCKDNPDEEEQLLVKGTHVLIEEGRHGGNYGIVDFMDMDYVIVKAARGEKTFHEKEQNLKIVSENEYNESSRVINQEMYHRFKKDEAKKKERRFDKDKNNKNSDSKVTRMREESKTRREEKNIRDEETIKIKEEVEKEYVIKVEEKRSNDDSIELLKQKIREKKMTKKIAEEEFDRSNKRMKKEEACKQSSKSVRKEEVSFRKSHKSSKSLTNYAEESLESVRTAQPTISWVRSNLRVRIIDKKYKGGIYHKEKVIVNDMESFDSCSCVTSDGKTLWDVNPNRLETVIPKTPYAIVFIIRGTYKGRKGKILELHREKEKASIQLLGNSSIIEKLHYDDICEYVQK